MVPATKDPMAAVANAWAARPALAILLPSIAVTTEEDSPGVLSRIEVIVPPYIAPRLEKKKLLGRGACDAKGIAAAMLCAAENLNAAGENRVDLLFVVGEEQGSDGARAANQLPATSKFLVNGEPSERV